MESLDPDKLTDSYHEMLKEQALIAKFEGELIAHAKVATNHFFKEHIHHLTADGYRALENKIGRHCSELVMAVLEIVERERG